MRATTYVALQPRTQSPGIDLEARGDAVAAHRSDDAVEVSTFARGDTRADALHQAGKSLGNLCAGAATGLGLGATLGGVAAVVTTVAWFGSESIAYDATGEMLDVSVEAGQLAKVLYRAEIVGHTLAGAALGAAVPLLPVRYVPQSQGAAVLAYTAGQSAGLAAALGGALTGYLLGTFGAFVFDMPEAGVVGALRPSFALLAYLAAAAACTRSMYASETTTHRPQQTTAPAASPLTPPPMPGASLQDARLSGDEREEISRSSHETERSDSGSSARLADYRALT